MFELKVGEEVVKLKWGTYAMKRFSVLDGHEEGPDHFFDVLQGFSPDAEPLPSARLLAIMEKLLIAGHDYATGNQVDDKIVDGWIDECGGVLKINNGPLVEYVNYIVKSTLTSVTPLPGDDTEKKNPT